MNGAAATPTSEIAETEALALIAEHGAEADAGARGLASDIELLASSGLLSRLSDPDTHPRKLVALLRRIGRASLSVGRLAEGHMNALRLISHYGTADQQQRHSSLAKSGEFYGVWGANASPPVRLSDVSGAECQLSGTKRFASGLGTVGYAVVTAETPDGTVMTVARVLDDGRADNSGWNVTGMRATASGTYDFQGVEAEILGKPGDYEREPHFEGGVWRYAALHVGGLEALAEAVRQSVAGFGGSATQAQMHRVARIAGLAHSARLFVEDAAIQVEKPEAGDLEVALSLAAREFVEGACLSGIAITDRALGTHSFSTGQTVERVRRDLSFFLRQADLDGKLQRAGQSLCQSQSPVGEFWHSG